MAREVKIAFLGDASDLNRATKSAGDDLDHFAKRAGTISGVVSSVTTAAINAIGAGARALGGFALDSLKAAEDSARVAKVQAQLLETTGNAAKVTGKQLSTYATQLSNVTGIDDELIAGGQNVLLTFKSVRNETGKGNNIFDRATASAADLAAIWGTDLVGANTKLGKALQDPVKGVTALSKAGVQFTTAQKDQIKALVKSNDLLGAQKIVLGEVEAETKGAAEANATATQKIAVAWDNTKEAIGGVALPAFTTLTDYLVTNVLPAVQSFADTAGPKIQAFGKLIADAFAAGVSGDTVTQLDGLAGAVQRVAQAGGTAFATTVDLLKQLGTWATDNKDALQVAAGALAGVGVALATISAANKGVSALSSLGSIASIGGALGPWGLLVVAILAAVGAIIVAYNKFSAFRDFVDGVWQTVQLGAQRVVTWLQTTFAPVWSQISDEVIGALQAIADFFVAVWNIILPVAEGELGFLQMLWQNFGAQVLSVVQATFAFIVGIIESVLRIIQGIFQVFTAALTGDWSGAWDGIKNIVSGVMSSIVGTIQFWARLIGAAVSIIGELLLAPFKYFADHVGGFFSGVGDLISGIFSKAVDQIKRYVNDLIGILNAAIGAYNKIPLAPNIPTIPTIRGAAAPSSAATSASARMLGAPSPVALASSSSAAPQTFGGVGSVVINLPSGVNGHDVIDAVRRYQRRNGASAVTWRAV